MSAADQDVRSRRVRPPHGFARPSSRDPGPVAGMRRHRHLAWVWVLVIVAAACAVGFTMVVRQLDDRRDVLVVTRAVAAGDVFETSDLGTARIAADATRDLIPAGDKDAVVGRTARLSLAAGSLLMHANLGPASEHPPPGKSLVAVAFEDGVVPADLAQGRRVALVPSAQANGGATVGGQEANRPRAPVAGIVAGVRDAAARPGVVIVTFLVDTAAVRTVADMVHPMLVLLPQQGVEQP